MMPPEFMCAFSDFLSSTFSFLSQHSRSLMSEIPFIFCLSWCEWWLVNSWWKYSMLGPFVINGVIQYWKLLYCCCCSLGEDSTIYAVDVLSPQIMMLVVQMIVFRNTPSFGDYSFSDNVSMSWYIGNVTVYVVCSLITSKPSFESLHVLC